MANKQVSVKPGPVQIKTYSFYQRDFHKLVEQSTYSCIGIALVHYTGDGGSKAGSEKSEGCDVPETTHLGMREKPRPVWHEDVICRIPHRCLYFQTGEGMAVLYF